MSLIINYLYFYWYEIKQYEIPYLHLNPKTKMIALMCFTMIFLSLLIKYTKRFFVGLKCTIQQLQKQKINKQIDDINEMFDEKVNIEAEPINDFLHFLKKFKGKSQQEKYDEMSTYNSNPQSLTEATFAYKPRNIQLLEKIKRETEEREKVNDPYFVNRFNRNAYNKQNDLANYTSMNPTPFAQNFDNNLYSQSMHAQQQQFITPSDGLHQNGLSLANGSDLMPKPQFGQTKFNYGEQNQINRRSGISFAAFSSETQSQQQYMPNISLTTKQQEIFSKISKDITKNGDAEEKAMDVEETHHLQQENNQIITPSIIDIPATNQNGNQLSQADENIPQIHQEIEIKNKVLKRKNNPMKGVLKKKLINKTSDHKLRPTRSSISTKDEQNMNGFKKKHNRVSNNDEEENNKYYRNEISYNNDEEYDDYDDEEFIIYKKAKKLKAVPSNKYRKLSQRVLHKDEYAQQKNMKHKERKLSSQSQSYQPILSTSSQNNMQNQNRYNNQNTYHQLQNNSLQQSYSQSQEQLQQQQQIIKSNNINQNLIQQQSLQKQNSQEQQQQLHQQQLQQQQIYQQINETPMIQQKISSHSQEDTENNLSNKNNKEELQTNSLALPAPKQQNKDAWNFGKKQQNQQPMNSKGQGLSIPFFDMDRFGHQSIQMTQKVDYEIYDEKKQQGFIATVVHNKNAYLMPNQLERLEGERENLEENKEDKSIDLSSGENKQ